MKFRGGDKVRTYKGDGVVVFVDYTDEMYLVKIEGYDGHGGGGVGGYINTDGVKDKRWFTEQALELIEPDLRDLLKVGQKIVYAGGVEVVLVDSSFINYFKTWWDSNLKSLPIWQTSDINAIYRPKYNGIKSIGNPQWELVWERKEKRYTLWCPMTDSYLAIVDYLTLGGDERSYYWAGSRYNAFKFTQSEIDNLPHQERVSALEKEEVTDE